jgi:hypothetical protein
MNPVAIEAVRKLADMGYRFTVIGETIKVKFHGPGEPDPGTVRPLLATVREHKPDVLAYLSKPAPRERIITCADCPHFEANQGPNPLQGWGKCLKRNRGRYGCATACEAALAPGPKDASNAHFEN